VQRNQQRLKNAAQNRDQAQYGGGDSMSWAPNLASDGAGASAGNVGTPSPPKKQRVQQPKLPACQFCGVREEEFRHSEKLDLHYVVSCLMLTNCNACGQIIEVSSLNSHLVKECVKKDQHKQCKRCRESIHIESYA